jgi:hypothetical protein
MEVFVFAVLLGLIPAFIAKRKGYSFLLWWFMGALLWIVVFPVSLFLKRKPDGIAAQRAAEGQKKCPQCAEWVQAEAQVCRFCGHKFA